MKNIMICLIMLLIVGCSKAPVLTVADRAALASHLAYSLVTNTSDVPDNKPDLVPGSKCPECGGRGKQGDGTIEFPCKACNGTGKVLPKTSNIFTREINDGTATFTWPPRELPDLSITPTGKVVTDAGHQTPAKTVVRRSNTKWSVNGKKSFTTEELIDHLQRDHHFDAVGYNRQQLEVIHDNLHNGFSALGDM